MRTNAGMQVPNATLPRAPFLGMTNRPWRRPFLLPHARRRRVIGVLQNGLVRENAAMESFYGGTHANKEREARIRKQLLEPEFSPSWYDTAWVAMVPLPGSPQVPCFPQCVEWIRQNQRSNGSWGGLTASCVNKDVLSATLACLIALKKWNVAPEHINKGLHFIGRNFSVVMDEQHTSPIGFNITFSHMLSLAIGMGLEFGVRQIDVDRILHLRQKELKRLAEDNSDGMEVYMAYLAEGLGNLLDWNRLRKFQRKNGSLFNSPSATAAVLIHSYDYESLQYLNMLVSEFYCGVPTVYPLNIHCQLIMVDTLEKIGISHHFSSDIKSILDMTYSFWSRREEEIMKNATTCAMAFRLLRMNGYNVSSDDLLYVGEASTFKNSLQGYLNDTKPILELYKASEIRISEDELILDNIGCWSGKLLTDIVCSDKVQRTSISGEVDYTLKFPFYATLERLYHKWNIEHFDVRGSQMLKTEYLPCQVNQDFLALAVEDFTFSQATYQDELVRLESWVDDNRLDRLQFARQKLKYCYLSSAGAIFAPELSDVRISLTKSSVLATVIDDFFDVKGSKEELKNLISLVEKWDEHHEDDFISDQVQIIFTALYTTVNQLGAAASAVQNRDVTKHLIELWLRLLRAEMIEVEWRMRQYVPTMEEYMKNAAVTTAMGPIVLTSLYFVGQEISGCIVQDQEYNKLFRLMSTCCRLLNDSISLERDEGDEKKLNSVLLLHLHSGGYMCKEAAREAIKKSALTFMTDLLRLVLKEEGVVPRPCKDLFWTMCKACFVFYSHTDAYTSPVEMVNAVNSVLYDPLKLPS